MATHQKRGKSALAQCWPRFSKAGSLSLPVTALLIGCSGGGSGSGEPIAVAPPPPPTASFRDATPSSELQVTNGFLDVMANNEIPLILPNGIAAGDIDNDGLIDLLIVRGDVGPNLLYRNLGALQFEDIAASSGLAFTKSATENYRHGSPALVDLDGDDDLDVLLPGLDGDPTLIYLNDGAGNFAIQANTGLEAMVSAYSFSPAFGDYDLDGDLDLLLGHWGTPRDFSSPGDTEHLWRNDSDGSSIRFVSVTETAGLSAPFITSDDPLITQRNFDYAFTPTFARINDDNYPDILLVADFNFSHVFFNNGNGSFGDATNYAVITDGNGMGSAVADYDGDGDLDWFVSSILATGENIPDHLSQVGNKLYRNDLGTFNDATDEAGVADGGWGWGSCFVDFDNDSNLDIYQTNGWPSFAQFGGFPTDETRAFVSQGDGTFVEDAARLGINDPEEGRGVVCGDFDRDGDVDIVQLHRNEDNAITLWQNTTSGTNYLGVQLRGFPPNTQGVGARITVSAGGKDQIRDVLLGSNFASHNATEQLFGLGDSNFVDNLVVDWPDGERTTMTGVDGNRHLVVDHPSR